MNIINKLQSSPNDNVFNGFTFKIKPLLFILLIIISMMFINLNIFATEFVNIDTIYNGGEARGVWGDGTYIYLANGSDGLRAYDFNGTKLTNVGNIDNGGGGDNVWGDGTYIYLANGTDGLRAYTFNGTTFTNVGHIDNGDSGSDVWGDGNYIYLANYTGGIRAYDFNGTAFTSVGYIDNGGEARGVWGDGNHIYLANGTDGLRAYTFNGTTFTSVGYIDNGGDARGVWGDGNYIYTTNYGGGLKAYTFNGTAFTNVGNIDNGGNYLRVWGDGTYIYVANYTEGLRAYDFNGTTFTNIANIDNGVDRDVWGDGTYIYTAHSAGGLAVYYFNLSSYVTPSQTTGTYNNDLNITLTTDQNDSIGIYYTTDGTDPDNTDTEYTGAITINATTNLKAVSYDGTDYSEIMDETYTMVVTNPTITQATGTYNNSFTTTITNPTTTGSSIYYTTDGSTPDNTDTLYTGAITINATQTLKAIAYKTGYTTSGVDSETYTMTVGGTPTASVDTGTYNNDFSVTLAKAGTTSGTTLTYTTNGASPTIASTEYTGEIPITATTTLKFAEFKTGYTNGIIVTKTYTMVVNEPIADISAGTYNNVITTYLTSTTNDTNIYYTLDGSDPDNTDTLYYGILNIFKTSTLKAIAYKTGYTNSSVLSNTYTFEVAGTPTASVDTGTYNNNFSVTLNKAGTTAGTSIYYTTDGSDPTTAKTLYSTPISITGTTTLKFAEFKTGYTPSEIQTKTYILEIFGDPTANVDTGTYNNNQTVTLSPEGTTTGTSIYYTTDGSDPDNTDNLYSSPITISGTTTLKFIDTKTGYTNSNVVTKTYTLEVGGTPTASVDSGTFYNTFDITLAKAGTTTGTTLTYTTNGTDPTIASTEYTGAISIPEGTTVVKFAEFKTGYTDGTIITKTYEVVLYKIKLQFYDENTLTKLDGNVSIVDLTNNETYYADENGYFEQKLENINWDNLQINAYVERKVDGITTHTSRNLQFYWTNEDHDYNFMLLPIDEGESIEFLVKDTNDNLWSNKYVQFADSNLNLISSNKTDSTGKFTSYLKTDGDYNAVLYDATGIEGDTYQKTTVNVKKPKNEKSLAAISPYDVEVGGLLIYSLSNQSAAQTSINIFGGTTSTYDFTVVDYNAGPVDRTYIPRTYNVKNPFGSSYNTTYNLQPYLITKEDGVIPSIVVYDELKTPYPGITVSIFKQIEGTTQLVEQKKTDSTGRTSFVGFPLDTYFVYLYENGTLKGSYEIQVRDTGETFYFVISREVDQDVVYRGLDLKYSWNNTPEYVDISSIDIDLNLSVYADYLNDFNITGYEIKAYQNNTLKETLTGDLSGTSVTIIDSLNRLNYTAGMPVKIVANITFDYAGQTRILNILKTINVDSKTTGLLTVLKNFPSKVGVLWTIILSILITISILVLFGTSDFVSKDYLMYVGLFILGFFVFIGWFATGVEVFGIDSMWFIYIVTVIASVGFALQDSQR
jgi:hypothetical protein